MYTSKPSKGAIELGLHKKQLSKLFREFWKLKHQDEFGRKS
jgi:hypothetical protein